MRAKKMMLSNFSRTDHRESFCVRPEQEEELGLFMASEQAYQALARGAGLSYNDSCLNQQNHIIDTSHLNHLIKFDPQTQQLICQAGVTFNDLFLVHSEFIPPVIPGTVHATLGGGIAHDVHGKNNPQAGSLGHHIHWLELLIGDKHYQCSREQHADLFYATLGGLGLTGVITRVALSLKKASRCVTVYEERYLSFDRLLSAMATTGLQYDYQVAWLDLLHETPRAILSAANHCSSTQHNKSRTYTVPHQPFALIKKWNMRLFNRFYFNRSLGKKQMTLTQFNNPLDRINDWNRLYGNKGLIQCQSVFSIEHAPQIVNELLELIKQYDATPTLAVLKLFTQPGAGIMSFCHTGFTLAIDFIANEQARKCIRAINELIAARGGRIYLAKDQLLNPELFKKMYPAYHDWLTTLKKYGCSMHSDLATRLGIDS